LNEAKKKIIELNKVQNYKPKTNLMIAEYKRTIQKIKNDHIGNITYTGQNKLYRNKINKNENINPIYNFSYIIIAKKQTDPKVLIISHSITQ
jgi:hypothetical protein